MIDDNIGEFEQFILDQIDYYDKGVDGKFAVLVSDINSKFDRANFISRTGNLRRSMNVKYVQDQNENSIVINMLDYGFFISFGVNGKKRSLGIPINEAVASGNFKIRYEPNHIFGSRSNPVKVPGIRPRKFYPLDIEENIIKILTENNQ
jgi:hypothetical protein